MKTKLLKEIKEGFDFAMQDAINKGLIKVIINDNGERVYCRWRDESNGEGGDTSSGKCEDAGMCLDDRKLIDEIRENGFEDTKDDCNTLCQMCNNRYGSTSSGCISICAHCQDSDYWNQNVMALSQST